MLRILQQLTPEEARQVALRCGARVGATPEEIVRALARACGATFLGLFPATTVEALLDHAGRRLGMPPLLATDRRALAGRERAIFACYLRQAWRGATPEQQRLLLQFALTAWDLPSVAKPVLSPDPNDTANLDPVLEAILQHSAGCRAIACALEAMPLALPPSAAEFGPFGPFGPFAIPPLRPADHAAFFDVLAILWRARARLLRERRRLRRQLEGELLQLESRLSLRRRHIEETPVPWTLEPASGLAVSAGAAVSLLTQFALPGTPLVLPALCFGVGGLMWSAIAALLRPSAATDPRIMQLAAQQDALRRRLAGVEQEIAALEME